jgi:heme-degrading monooxygenase HmoA
MIARIWHGRVPRAKADEYLAFLHESGLADYRATPGNLAAFVLRRDEGDVTHFLTISHWPDLESIKAFAGDDIAKAHYYDRDREFLLEFEPEVQHYELHTSD